MKLEEALKQASLEVVRSTSGSVPGPVPTPRSRRPFALMAGLVLLLGVAVIAVGSRDGGSTLSTDAAVADDQGADEPQDVPDDPADDGSTPAQSSDLARYVTDAPPEGLSLVYAGPVSELEAIGTETRWVYGHRDRGPATDERAIVVMALSGEGTPSGLLDGRDVDINGAAGRILPDGTVMFGAGEAMVMVHGNEVDHDLVAVARSIEVLPDGQVAPPPTGPGGYVRLGTFDENRYAEVDRTVPVDAQAVTYRQGYVRYLDLMSRPRTAELDHLYAWLTPSDSETVTIDGTTMTYMRFHEDFGAPFSWVVWFEDDAINEAISYGIGRSDLDQALANLRTDGDEPRRNAPPESEPDSTTSGPASDIATDVGDDFVPMVVLDDLEIIRGVDHGALGPPDWSAEQYLYGPADVDQPDGDDPVLLLTVASRSDGLLEGRPIEVGGHDAVVVDKASTGSTADVEVAIGETMVQLTGRANVELETVIAAAEQYATWTLGAGGVGVGAPSTIGVDLTLRHRETIGAWYQADVNGPLDAKTVIYAEPGTTSEDDASRLTVSTSPSSNRSVAWLSWLHPGRTTTVTVGGTEATLVNPVEHVTVVRFELSGRVIEITGTRVGTDAVLAAANSFSAAGQEGQG